MKSKISAVMIRVLVLTAVGISLRKLIRFPLKLRLSTEQTVILHLAQTNFYQTAMKVKTQVLRLTLQMPITTARQLVRVQSTAVNSVFMLKQTPMLITISLAGTLRPLTVIHSLLMSPMLTSQ